MNYTKTEERLIEAMGQMRIIDCHEHLPPESERTGTQQDVFTLFSHYTRCDLFSSGMDRNDPVNRREHAGLLNPDEPLEKRWARFRPYWQHIRYGSYARAAILSAKLLYDIDDINDDTYAELSHRIAAENTAGIYERVLCDKCRIATALTQCSSCDVERPLVPLMPLSSICDLHNRQEIEKAADEFGVKVASLSDYKAVVRRIIEKWVNSGCVGLKAHSRYNEPPDEKAAQGSFARMLSGEELVPVKRSLFEPLWNYLLHYCLELAVEFNLVVAVHAGIWGDYRDLDCKDMLTLAPAHPDVNFDLYHLGMPFVRDAIVVAKNLPNVYLNLCWTHIISRVQTCSGIEELLDQVPVNKILAFGGDYHRPVEKVIGHLHMAREDFAQVFGRRIDRGLMSFEQAVDILHRWFWDNPLELYSRLKV